MNEQALHSAFHRKGKKRVEKGSKIPF